MMRFVTATLVLLATCIGPAGADEPVVEIAPDPPTVRLVGPQATYSLLVHGKTSAGKLVDLTRSARFQVKDAKVTQVGPTGVFRAVGDGTTDVEIEAFGQKKLVRVEVSDSAKPRA